eukprot:TRINITY_DN7800_c0_g1_i1.p1 TRINITY_DN7800_c0_g1~~TRINITY_DN7800_c0_g1_i1.p1  ORF type:complete len:316 (-),score=49.75 TRINITY_DN7800_c0_g1_i1:256-1203(-)
MQRPSNTRKRQTSDDDALHDSAKRPGHATAAKATPEPLVPIEVMPNHELRFSVALCARNQTILVARKSAHSPAVGFHVRGHMPVFPCQITTDATSYQFVVKIDGKRTKREIETSFCLVEERTMNPIMHSFKTKGEGGHTQNAFTTMSVTGMHKSNSSDHFGFCKTSCEIFSCATVTMLQALDNHGLVRLRATINIGRETKATLYSPPFWIVSKRLPDIRIFYGDSPEWPIFHCMPHVIDKGNVVLAPKDQIDAEDGLSVLDGATPVHKESLDDSNAGTRINRTITLFFDCKYEQIGNADLVSAQNRSSTTASLSD